MRETTETFPHGRRAAGRPWARQRGRYGARALAIGQAPDLFMAPRAIAFDNEAPLAGSAVVSPKCTVLHDGPLQELDTIVSEAWARSVHRTGPQLERKAIPHWTY